MHTHSTHIALGVAVYHKVNIVSSNVNQITRHQVKPPAVQQLMWSWLAWTHQLAIMHAYFEPDSNSRLMSE